MSSRDRYLKEQETACDVAKTARSLTVRDRLEMRKAELQNRIELAQLDLEEIEAGLKLLNKNKELETLANLLTL